MVSTNIVLWKSVEDNTVPVCVQFFWIWRPNQRDSVFVFDIFLFLSDIYFFTEAVLHSINIWYEQNDSDRTVKGHVLFVWHVWIKPFT